MYFVSHGGEGFPELEIVLQGEGVRVDLTAARFISKAGITSRTFKPVPDAPISSFELYLPEGKYSILGANVPAKAKDSFCGQKLQAQTAFTGQNGAAIKQSTKIAITGCPPVRPKAHPKTRLVESQAGRRRREGRFRGVRG